jgi:hypothetical protein
VVSDRRIVGLDVGAAFTKARDAARGLWQRMGAFP